MNMFFGCVSQESSELGNLIDKVFKGKMKSKCSYLETIYYLNLIVKFFDSLYHVLL